MDATTDKVIGCVGIKHPEEHAASRIKGGVASEEPFASKSWLVRGHFLSLTEAWDEFML